MEPVAVFESTYAPAQRARGFAADARGARYARWALRAPERVFSAADAVTERFLRRGALIPAPDRLERPLAKLLGDRLQAGLRAAHQLQLAALRAGADRPRTDLHELGLFSWRES